MPILNRYADIFFGYTPRYQLTDVDTGAYTFLQPKDFNPLSSTFELKEAARIDGSIAGKYMLKKGDLLISCKGKNTPVIVLEIDIPNLVASSAFAIVRTVSNKLDPYFLAWYLKQPEPQAHLLSRKAGTTVLNLPIKAIQDLNVPIPQIGHQEILGELYRDRIRLRTIQHELLEKETHLMDSNFLQLLKQYTD